MDFITKVYDFVIKFIFYLHNIDKLIKYDIIIIFETINFILDALHQKGGSIWLKR